MWKRRPYPRKPIHVRWRMMPFMNPPDMSRMHKTMHPIQAKVLHDKKSINFKYRGNPNMVAWTYLGTGIRSVMTTAI